MPRAYRRTHGLRLAHPLRSLLALREGLSLVFLSVIGNLLAYSLPSTSLSPASCEARMGVVLPDHRGPRPPGVEGYAVVHLHSCSG